MACRAESSLVGSDRPGTTAAITASAAATTALAAGSVAVGYLPRVASDGGQRDLGRSASLTTALLIVRSHLFVLRQLLALASLRLHALVQTL